MNNPKRSVQFGSRKILTCTKNWHYSSFFSVFFFFFCSLFFIKYLRLTSNGLLLHCFMDNSSLLLQRWLTFIVIPKRKAGELWFYGWGGGAKWPRKKQAVNTRSTDLDFWKSQQQIVFLLFIFLLFEIQWRKKILDNLYIYNF